MNFERSKDVLKSTNIGLNKDAIEIISLVRRIIQNNNEYRTTQADKTLHKVLKKMERGYLPPKAYAGYSNENVEELRMEFVIYDPDKEESKITYLKPLNILGLTVKYEDKFYIIPPVSDPVWSRLKSIYS